MGNPFTKKGIIIYSLSFFILSFSFDVTYEVHRFIYVITFASLLNFLSVLDKKFALPELIGFLTIIMFTASPALMFDIDSQQFIPSNAYGYSIIAIPPITYYYYAVPSVLIFYLIITQQFKAYRTKEYMIFVIKKIKERYDIKKIIILFSIISFFSSLLLGRLLVLNHIFTLGTQLLTIILILTLLLDTKKTKKIVFIFVIGLLLLNTLRTGMFSELVFSLLFYALFWVMINGLSNKIKIILPIIAIILFFFLQLFKGDYRKETWSVDQKVNNFDIALSVIENINNEFNSDYLKLKITYTLMRLNQAHSTSRALRYVPEVESYAYGETILSAFLSLIPRVFWPDKPELSDREMVIKYGKHTPDGNTTMGIAQLGESYVNFGYIGGALFFGVYGFFIAYTLSFLVSKSINGKPYILFIPIIMYHMTKPEVMYSKAFNTAFKGIIFFLLIMVLVNFFCRKKSNYQSFTP